MLKLVLALIPYILHAIKILTLMLLKDTLFLKLFFLFRIFQFYDFLNLNSILVEPVSISTLSHIFESKFM